ncbi:hypothetical protein ZIOFF_035023 [Zingiber officinale]|uniref:Uncharacterized protein n=1 Tax=Zingiber officinale TaxID=94328 RepID=A0A8J5L6W0_ZINOF|nr:hypothetical protein ZIOFF_035023 [Zingiber officinale]
MPSLIAHKPPPSPDGGESALALPATAVSSYLCLKAAAGEPRSLDREVVLRRIRHRKRVAWVRSALRTLLKPAAQPTSAGGRETKEKNVVEREPNYSSWLDDAFAFP